VCALKEATSAEFRLKCMETLFSRKREFQPEEDLFTCLLNVRLLKYHLIAHTVLLLILAVSERT
jgi:hypothetical protein